MLHVQRSDSPILQFCVQVYSEFADNEVTKL